MAYRAVSQEVSGVGKSKSSSLELLQSAIIRGRAVPLVANGSTW